MLATAACSTHARPDRSSSTSARPRRAPRAGLPRRSTRRASSYIDAGISGGAAAAEQGDADDHGRAAPSRRWTGRARLLDCFQLTRLPHGRERRGHTAKLLNNFLNGVSLAATAEVMVAGKKAGPRPGDVARRHQPARGVNFASINRFPKIIEGDYLEGGLTSDLMTKDVLLYVELAAAARGCRRSTPPVPIAAFGLAADSATATRSAIAWSTRSATSPAASACRTTRNTPKRPRRHSEDRSTAGRPDPIAELRWDDVHRGGLGRLGARPRGNTVNTYFHPRSRGPTGTPTSADRSCWSLAGRAGCDGAAASGGEIRPGDTVWVAPGEEPLARRRRRDSCSHRAISLGVTDWLEWPTRHGRRRRRGRDSR